MHSPVIRALATNVVQVVRFRDIVVSVPLHGIDGVEDDGSGVVRPQLGAKV